MRILFIHHRFPGQFKPLVEHYAKQAAQMVAVCQDSDNAALDADIWSRLTVKRYSESHSASDFNLYARSILSNSVKVRAILVELKTQGFCPDLCLAHIGFGDSLFVKDVFLNTLFIAYCEYYYQANGLDAGFDPEFSVAEPEALDIKTPNAYTLLALNDADAAISPTHWQKNLFPSLHRSRIEVIHEGVDVDLCKPNKRACFKLPNGKGLRHGDEVLTYATRNLEPYRGFHQFMRAAAILMKRRPKLQVVVAGGDEVSYSTHLANGQTYRERMMAEVDMDVSRIHFVGRLSFAHYCVLLQVSAVHVYLTIPFVLSWSLLEAMAIQCAIVASDTAPVRELLRDGYNALLVDFFVPSQMAAQIEKLLDDPFLRKNLSVNARRTIVEGYDREQSIKRYEAFLKRIKPQHFKN